MGIWNLGGMNPEYKDFLEKHPSKTMIGMMWALQWRFMVFILIAEAVLFLLFFIAVSLLGSGA